MADRKTGPRIVANGSVAAVLDAPPLIDPNVAPLVPSNGAVAEAEASSEAEAGSEVDTGAEAAPGTSQDSPTESGTVDTGSEAEAEAEAEASSEAPVAPVAPVDPVVTLCDTARRFGIPDALIERYSIPTKLPMLQMLVDDAVSDASAKLVAQLDVPAQRLARSVQWLRDDLVAGTVPNDSTWDGLTFAYTELLAAGGRNVKIASTHTASTKKAPAPGTGSTKSDSPQTADTMAYNAVTRAIYKAMGAKNVSDAADKVPGKIFRSAQFQVARGIHAGLAGYCGLVPHRIFLDSKPGLRALYAEGQSLRATAIAAEKTPGALPYIRPGTGMSLTETIIPTAAIDAVLAAENAAIHAAAPAPAPVDAPTV